MHDFECMKSIFIFSSESLVSFQYVRNHFPFNPCEQRLFLKSVVVFLKLSLCCHIGPLFVADCMPVISGTDLVNSSKTIPEHLISFIVLVI
jgi:hypothetical protein